MSKTVWFLFGFHTNLIEMFPVQVPFSTWFCSRRQQQQKRKNKMNERICFPFEDFSRVKFPQRHGRKYLFFTLFVTLLFALERTRDYEHKALFIFFIWNWDVSGFLCYWDIHLHFLYILFIEMLTFFGFFFWEGRLTTSCFTIFWSYSTEESLVRLWG